MRIMIVEDSATTELVVALNALAGEQAIVACNFDLEVAGEAPPEMLLLVPAGAVVAGRDGRAWNNPDPAAIARYYQENKLDIPIDIEHATQHKAPKGDAAPAMAWCSALEVRPDGSVWGKTAWNEAGTALVMSRQYRYYSPAYIIDTKTQTIVGIKSVGLTNTPNLDVPALNHEQQKGETMNLVALLAALGMASTATFDDALNQITKMKGDLTTALNAAQSPPLDKFVPRADYDTALNRATTAEGKLKEQANEAQQTAINAEIDAALKAGKITPATKEYHVAACKEQGGLERFKAFVAAAPVVAADSGLAGKKPEQGTALNADERKVLDAMGLTEEQYRKANNL